MTINIRKTGKDAGKAKSIRNPGKQPGKQKDDQRVIPLKRGKPVRRSVGDAADNTVCITEQMVKVYAALTGDENPIHVDKETGKKSIFGSNIAHGMLVGSLFGPIIVNKLIGPGAIYRKQTLEFDAPVPIGEAVTAVVTVQEAKYKEDKDVYVLQTECFLKNGQRVITGEAVIIVLASGLMTKSDKPRGASDSPPQESTG